MRAAIGIVPQDTVLFNDTIEYNIAYGRPGATHDEIVAAAKLAQIHDFIAQLARRATRRRSASAASSSRAARSSGWRSRARCSRSRAILIFDEATSALDSKSEKAIQAELKRIARDRTTLTIAHRLSTIVDADEILVLDHGRIVERGTHAALLARTASTRGCGGCSRMRRVRPPRRTSGSRFDAPTTHRRSIPTPRRWRTGQRLAGRRHVAGGVRSSAAGTGPTAQVLAASGGQLPPRGTTLPCVFARAVPLL